MNYIKNKQPLLLLLFLLSPLTTQCMIVARKTIQELKNDRNELQKKLDCSYEDTVLSGFLIGQPPKSPLAITYFQWLHKQELNEISNTPRLWIFEFVPDGWINEKCFGNFNIDCLEQTVQNPTFKKIFQEARITDYSILGSATMAQKVCFFEKKIFIAKLIAMGFEPTVGDKELALIEQLERSKDIIPKIYSFIFSINKNNTDTLSKLPHDVLKYIVLLMLNTVGRLF